MLTGDVPFKGDNAPKTLTKHVFDAVVPPSKFRPDLEIPLVAEEIVMRMLQKKANDRFSDMRALIEAFEAALQKIEAGQAPGRKTHVDGIARPTAAPLTASTDKVDELPRNKTPIYVAVAVSAAALVVLVGVAVTRLGGKPAARTAAVAPAPATTPQPAAAPSATTPAAPTEAAAPVAKPPAEVQLQIATVPAGAEVFLGTESLGISPVDVRHARVTEPLTLTLRHAGFKEERRPFTLDHEQTLEIVLQPKRDRVAVRAARPQKPQSPPQQQPNTAPQHHVTDLRNPFE
jgi:hypothetical protein